MIGVIRSGFSTLRVVNAMHVPVLGVHEATLCHISERSLVDGGIVFSIVYPGDNNDEFYYVKKVPLGIKDQDGKLITPSRIFHSIRVRTKEELSNLRASRATLFSLFLLIGFQVIDWMIPFDAVLSFQQSCILLSVLVFSIIGLNFSFVVDYAIEKIFRRS
ncbi:MAG TPA: hypothetical protein VMW03_01870 [Candidatus Krumholzibacteriaceae bacterium]|nr:hypothetical protein [Candidatus Krumholzibacteriaceae bacterium]